MGKQATLLMFRPTEICFFADSARFPKDFVLDATGEELHAGGCPHEPKPFHAGRVGFRSVSEQDSSSPRGIERIEGPENGLGRKP